MSAPGGALARFAVIGNARAIERSALPQLPTSELLGAISDAVAAGCRVAALFGMADPDPAAVALIAVLADDRPGRLYLGGARVRGGEFESRTPTCPQLQLFEREIAEQFGLRAVGHPWFKPVRYQRSYRPGFEAFARGENDGPAIGVTDFYRVEGDEVHEVAVGPVHAGIIEPGHFRFSIVGEKVLRLEQRLGYKHKGIEKRFEAMTLEEGARLAGRVSGDSTAAYAWAYAMALEGMAGAHPSARALYLRALVLERERIANHLGDLGYLGNDCALAFGFAQFWRLKEEWLRANARAFGHRYLMDRIVPGGVAADVAPAEAQALLAEGERLREELRTLRRIYYNHAGLQDRCITTGRVLPRTAARLGVVGLAARASGHAMDARAHPGYAPYDKLAPKVASHRNGDVAARIVVRFEEAFESLRLQRHILQQLPGGALRVPLAQPPEGAFGIGWVEGWRGEVLVALDAAADGRVRRCHPHDPSWQNWPALEHAVIGNIVPDFPLINKSFNLSYAGADL
jgi:Ni,Fe-hydrogenase III large subunit